MSMLTHTYPHKPLKKIKVAIYAITRLTAHLMCGLMSDLVSCKFKKVWSYTTTNVLLRPGVIKQHKPNFPDKIQPTNTVHCDHEWQSGSSHSLSPPQQSTNHKPSTLWSRMVILIYSLPGQDLIHTKHSALWSRMHIPTIPIPISPYWELLLSRINTVVLVIILHNKTAPPSTCVDWKGPEVARLDRLRGSFLNTYG